jgi:hypothetical protein
MQPIIDLFTKLRPLPPGLQDRLASVFKLENVRQKQFLLVIGEIPSHLYFVAHGSFFAYGKDAGKVIHPLYIITGQPMVKFQHFLNRTASDEDIICFMQGTVYAISFADVKAILSDYPDFEFYLSKVWNRPAAKVDEPVIIPSQREDNMIRELGRGYANHIGKFLHKYLFRPVWHYKAGLLKRLHR